MSKWHEAEQNYPVGCTITVDGKSYTVSGIEGNASEDTIYVKANQQVAGDPEKCAAIPKLVPVARCGVASRLPANLPPKTECNMWGLPSIAQELAKLNQMSVPFRDELHKQQKLNEIPVHEIAKGNDTRWWSRRQGLADCQRSRVPISIVPVKKPKVNCGKVDAKFVDFDNKKVVCKFDIRPLIVDLKSEFWKFMPEIAQVFEFLHGVFCENTQQNGLALGSGVNFAFRSQRLITELYPEKTGNAAKNAWNKKMRKFINHAYNFGLRHLFEGSARSLYIAAFFLVPTGGEGDKEPLSNVPANAFDLTLEVVMRHMPNATRHAARDLLVKFMSDAGFFAVSYLRAALVGASKLPPIAWWKFAIKNAPDTETRDFCSACKTIQSYPCAAVCCERVNSCLGWMHSSRRAKLTDPHLLQMAFQRMNRHLRPA
eukprot:gene6417-3138_t